MLIMESSTIIPNTTIMAAKVTVFNSILNKYINATQHAVQIGRPVLATRAVLIGKSIIITNITTAMEMNKSRRNEVTDLDTTCGWSVIRYMCTLSGKSSSNFSNTFSTFLPKETILLPFRISTDITMAFLPL